jgi:hypothetical protein
MHRVDAQGVAGEVSPAPAEFAVDGIDSACAVSTPAAVQASAPSRSRSSWVVATSHGFHGA